MVPRSCRIILGMACGHLPPAVGVCVPQVRMCPLNFHFVALPLVTPPTAFALFVWDSETSEGCHKKYGGKAFQR